jgi:cytochrome c-type biogenesis protein CcmH/NrfG
MRALFVLLIFSSAACLTGCVSIARSPQPAAAAQPRVNPAAVARFADALELERKGKGKLALAKYQAAADADPWFVEAHVAVGRLARAQKNNSLAADAYTRAVQLEPDNYEYLPDAIYAFWAAGRYADGVPLLERYVKADKRNWAARTMLAYGYLRSGKYGQSLAEYDMVVSFTKGNAAIKSLREDLIEMIEMQGEVAKNPDNAICLLRLSLAEWRVGAVDQGIDHMRKLANGKGKLSVEGRRLLKKMTAERALQQKRTAPKRQPLR